MFVLHPVAATAALAAGVVAFDSRAPRPGRRLLVALVALLVAMTVFVIAAVTLHWGELDATSRVVIAGLGVLALYMVHRALHAV